MLEPVDDRGGSLDVAGRQGRLEPIAVELEASRMERAARRRGPLGGGQLGVGLDDVADRQGHEPEDLPVVDLEGQVAARERQVEALGRQSPGLVVRPSCAATSARPRSRHDGNTSAPSRP